MYAVTKEVLSIHIDCPVGRGGKGRKATHMKPDHQSLVGTQPGPQASYPPGIRIKITRLRNTLPLYPEEFFPKVKFKFSLDLGPVSFNLGL